jgi:ankyrin repeat protein
VRAGFGLLSGNHKNSFKGKKMKASLKDSLDNIRLRSSCGRLSGRLFLFLPVLIVLLFLGWLGVRTVLRRAASQSNVRQVRILLDSAAGPRTINSTNMYGYGPMQLAAQNGHADVLEMLIEGGGDVNLRRPSSWNSPLVMAASRGHVDCCRLLLDKGADPSAYGMFGGTRHTALQSAAKEGHIEVVKLFLGRGIGPNEKQGSTSALHRACRWNHLDVVKELVAAGADITSRQEWRGNTPLQFAVKFENDEIAAYLKPMVASKRDIENEHRLFDTINASVQKSGELVIEAYIPIAARFVVDSNGIHWESRNGGKPGTNFGQKRNDPTYVNGIAWYPFWSTGIYEKALDQSEPCPVRIPSVDGIRFELLGVGESRDSYSMKACPAIKTFRYPNDEFAIFLAGTELHFKWCRFRLFW